MTGLLLFCFPPAAAFVHPQSSPPKSFISAPIRVSLLFLHLCSEFLHKSLIPIGCRGGGTPLRPPFKEPENTASDSSSLDISAILRLYPCGMISNLFNSTAILVSTT